MRLTRKQFFAAMIGAPAVAAVPLTPSDEQFIAYRGIAVEKISKALAVPAPEALMVTLKLDTTALDRIDLGAVRW